jgi:hypothetical protein
MRHSNTTMQRFPSNFNGINLQKKLDSGHCQWQHNQQDIYFKKNINQENCLIKYRTKIYKNYLQTKNNLLEISLDNDFFREKIYNLLRTELEKLQLTSEIIEINNSTIFGTGDNAILRENINIYLRIRPK